ncbi:MAG: IS110 family transposase [Spirochaetes bacterium]|nr:MAG: IS110 family transposase [Spirochaetota bacterium]
MKTYCGIDLHSNNNVVVVIDENDHILLEQTLSNHLGVILDTLSKIRESIDGIAVESTYNWYWLVDGLQEAGYKLHLVNTAAIKQYEGLKYSDDKRDAFHLAHLLRLGILPTGYIYPKEERAIRDLLRKRLQLVQQRTAQILSIQNQITRNTGRQLKANEVKKLTTSTVKDRIKNKNIQQAILSNVTVMNVLTSKIESLEKQVLEQVEVKEAFKKLLQITGIGPIIALTIMLETGDINRFNKVGNYSSYCRCVNSKRFSNGKQKGQGNRKNGNKYLAWAYMEAANYAIRFNEKARQFYQRKIAKTKRVVALKALAHKLARACYYVLKNNEDFDNQRLFPG